MTMFDDFGENLVTVFKFYGFATSPLTKSGYSAQLFKEKGFYDIPTPAQEEFVVFPIHPFIIHPLRR